MLSVLVSKCIRTEMRLFRSMMVVMVVRCHGDSNQVQENGSNRRIY